MVQKRGVPFWETENIYSAAQSAVATFPANKSTKIFIIRAVDCLSAVCESKAALRGKMRRLASLLPEYDVVMDMQSTSDVTDPKLMAKIGDVRRFTGKRALVAFASVDVPPYQSGNFEAKSRHVSKCAPPTFAQDAVPYYERCAAAWLHG